MLGLGLGETYTCLSALQRASKVIACGVSILAMYSRSALLVGTLRPDSSGILVGVVWLRRRLMVVGGSAGWGRRSGVVGGAGSDIGVEYSGMGSISDRMCGWE